MVVERRSIVAVAALAALLLLAGAAVWLLRPARPASLLLVTIDTLRADRLGSYGYRAAQTPALDALAARGLRFADAVTVAPLTLPAHASLFTGTFPAFHGVRDNGGFYLDDGQVTLAEQLKARGYRTGGFVGAFVLDSRWGIAQGFDEYFDDFDLAAAGPGMDTIQRPGGEVVDRALAWLDRDTARPVFAWVHLYDPHTPYEPPEPYRSRFPATLSGAYDGEIAWSDAQTGRLLASLEADGRLANTYVIVLSDHGESLGEHQEQTHGFFVYDATVRIPLIVAGPGLPARTVPDQVRIVDVMPTALELLGAPIPPAVQGRSLVPAARGERLDLLAYAESWYPRYHYGWSELLSVRDGRYKFVRAPRRELYDLQHDPGETTNLADATPGRADALERALADLVARTESAAAATGPQPIDPEVEERLRALGYVGASVSPRHLERPARGDPKDKIGLYNLLLRAGDDSVRGRLDEAIVKVREALAADAEIVQAHVMLGNLHVKAARHAEAVGAYRQALALDPENYGATFSLALAYKNLGRLADAEAGFARAKDLDPRSGKAYFQLADVWMRQGAFARARDVLEHALTLEVERGSFLVKLGECYIELERLDEAEKALGEALQADPRVARAHYDLGLIHEARGAADKAMAAYEAELAHNPGSFSAAFNLGKLLSRAGRHRDAVARFREAVTANPKFGAGYLYLAKALLDTGDLQAAEATARQGLAANPERQVAPLGHFVLADVYNRLGREADAARELAAARRLQDGR